MKREPNQRKDRFGYDLVNGEWHRYLVATGSDGRGRGQSRPGKLEAGQAEDPETRGLNPGIQYRQWLKHVLQLGQRVMDATWGACKVLVEGRPNTVWLALLDPPALVCPRKSRRRPPLKRRARVPLAPSSQPRELAWAELAA